MLRPRRTALGDRRGQRPSKHARRWRVTRAEPGATAPGSSKTLEKKEGASTDLKVIYERLVQLSRPYWVDNPDANKPRLALAGVVVLSLMTTGVSVVFSYLGRDFFNALSAKDVDTFYSQLVKYLGGFAVGIPIFIFRDYYMSLLALRWREWMTEKTLNEYMSHRTFYNVQAAGIVDNPDQRLTSDIASFTSSTLSIAFVILTSLVDLISFSGILFSIYPPLFGVLLVYSVGGTALSFYIGKKLVGLNFAQEAREADFRYGLVRVRENTEAIAFYAGERSEVGLLIRRLGRLVANYRNLLVASRNLDAFQSAYRYIIILLPAAVVAPLFFRGEIEFGVVNQSQSAFSHILGDVSIVVNQFETLAGFSAVVDRLGEFQEAVDARGRSADAGGGGNGAAPEVPSGSEISLTESHPKADVPLRLTGVTLCTPDYRTLLVRDLELEVARGSRVLIMGPSGCGKTSLLRAVAGLWHSGGGHIERPRQGTAAGPGTGMMLVPQRPYMALGSLRQQLLYPDFDTAIVAEALEGYDDADAAGGVAGGGPLDPRVDPVVGGGALTEEEGGVGGDGGRGRREDVPEDAALLDTMRQVGLGDVLDRLTARAGESGALGVTADWASTLSQGEQQRLAVARVLLARPAVALLDESTSALDVAKEAQLYRLLKGAGITYVSVGHRPTLTEWHDSVLQLGRGEDGTGWHLRPADCEAVGVHSQVAD